MQSQSGLAGIHHEDLLSLDVSRRRIPHSYDSGNRRVVFYGDQLNSEQRMQSQEKLIRLKAVVVVDGRP